MEAGENEETLSIGRFVFSKAGFDKACQILRDTIHEDGWMVIDEIGPMELRGEGFCEVLKEILTRRKEKIILVVREGMAEKVKDHFRISATRVIRDISFINAG